MSDEIIKTNADAYLKEFDKAAKNAQVKGYSADKLKKHIDSIFKKG